MFKIKDRDGINAVKFYNLTLSDHSSDTTEALLEGTVEFLLVDTTKEMALGSVPVAIIDVSEPTMDLLRNFINAVETEVGTMCLTSGTRAQEGTKDEVAVGQTSLNSLRR